MAVLAQNIITQRLVTCVKALISSQKTPSARQLALELGYKPQGLSEIINGKRNAPTELIAKAAESYGLNLKYLFFGEGHMFNNDVSHQPVNTRVVVTDVYQNERIVHVPVAAHAGYRDNLTEPVYVKDLPTYALPENILRSGSYRSFEVYGESMEPTLMSGDKVIAAYVEPQYWEQGIKDNMIHVLVTHNEVVVKRVINYIRAEKVLELHSDNSVISPYILPITELREAWVVRLKITSVLNKPDSVDLLNEIRQTVASLTGRAPLRSIRAK